MQGVWSQIQLQGHFHPGAWRSYWTSKEARTTATGTTFYERQ